MMARGPPCGTEVRHTYGSSENQPKEGTMANMNHQPKPFLATLISEALESMPITAAERSDAVAVLGTYGEKGVVFFPQDAGTTEDPCAMVGFVMVGKGIPAKHYNVGRDAAMDLVRLLVEQYGIQVGYEAVTTIEVTVE